MVDKGHFEGSPEPSEIIDIISTFTVNTGTFQYEADLERADNLLGNAGTPNQAGFILAYHVTDDPSAVLSRLKEGGDLGTETFWGDLCPGLYVSGVPDYWKSRSRRKWDFLKSVSAAEAASIQEAVLIELGRQKETHYISESEYDVGARAVEMWRKSGFWEGILRVAGQPYNINIQNMARDIGIVPFEPAVVPVHLSGRFLRMMEREVFDALNDLAELMFRIPVKKVTKADVCRVMKEIGLDGAFQTSGFSTASQMVVWNASAVTAFGAYQKAPASLGARRGEGPTYVTGERFEASVGEVPKLALFSDLRRNGNRPHLGPLRKRDVQELVLLFEGPEDRTHRFLIKALPNGFELRDNIAGGKFLAMSDEDMTELYKLSQDIETRMI